MMDIIYCGNCSIDTIISNELESISFGGSALNSSLISSLNDLKIGVIGTIGTDFDERVLKNIIFLGDSINDKSNAFSINEDTGTCTLQNDNYLPMVNIRKIKTRHLHVSFRAGVDVETILSSELEFDTLSIDVMKYSLLNFLPIIEKYKSKIDLIFCNAEEYQMLQSIGFENSKFIVTNEEKPIIYINNDIFAFNIPKIDFPIKSFTGAGDSFIGGFLSEWIQGGQLKQNVNSGVAASRLCLQVNGNYNITANQYKREKEKTIPIVKQNKLPKNVIVIGNSCAGKSTFANYLNSIYPIYDDRDDYLPLKEVFDLDDFTKQNPDKSKLVEIGSNVKFIQPIYEEYLKLFPNINFYSSRSSGKGHNIERAILWDLILQYTVQNISNPYNIIQFSRGHDELYERQFGKDVYERSIKIIVNHLSEIDDILIVNITSNLNTRKERNIDRLNKGGHFVSDETMDTVYKDDVSFETLCGIPVYNLYNTRQFENEIERKQFFLYNIEEIIFNYNRGGNNNGFDEITKRSFSKQKK